jgi:hypothetical protein
MEMTHRNKIFMPLSHWPSLLLALVKTAKRYLLFRSWKFFVFCRAKIGRVRLDVNKTIYANPSNMNLALLKGKGGLAMFYDRGRIKGRNWDQKAIKFEDLEVFRAIHGRFMDNKPWDETEFYRRILKRISKGETLWACRSKREFDERLRGLESIYFDMKKNGYRSQTDISSYVGNKYIQADDEVNVYINRHGQLLVGEGIHRVSMAKLCGINKIPAKVAMRHRDWYRFRMEIISFVKLRHGGRAYHPFTHPDLQDIPFEHGINRFEIIRPHVQGVPAGDLLDIGANWGYFCHRFEELGFRCHAVEVDPVSVYFLKKLKLAENRKFEVLEQSILACKGKMNFTVVLALNIFHHFLKSELTYRHFIDLLARLKTDLMFFQPHLPSDPQMKDAYVNYDCDDFAKLVARHSRLARYELIGRDQDERPIYKLYN